MDEPVDARGGERRSEQRPSRADEGDGERKAEPEREQHEADDPRLAELVELEGMGPLRRLDAATVLEVDGGEAAPADTGERMVLEGAERDPPEVVPVRPEREEVAGPLLARRERLERAPLVGEEVAGPVDGHGEACRSPRERGDDGEKLR